MRRTWRRALTLVLVGAGACGGRAALEQSPGAGTPNARAGASAAHEGGAGGAPPGQSTGPKDAGSDALSGRWRHELEGGVPWDTLPMPEAGTDADCLACARDKCREVVDRCVQDEACLWGMTCAALDCGDTDAPVCPPRCREGNSSSILAGAAAAACLITQCEKSCRSFLSFVEAENTASSAASRAGSGGGVAE
ncbi:MAG: hypothetical protein JW940_29750 [Polyangiaceae bacterium]|nr:hypothetical protein [Polyangiaceae bacterium]